MTKFRYIHFFARNSMQWCNCRRSSFLRVLIGLMVAVLAALTTDDLTHAAEIPNIAYFASEPQLYEHSTGRELFGYMLRFPQKERLGVLSLNRPADVSKCLVSGAFAVNGYYHLSGDSSGCSVLQGKPGETEAWMKVDLMSQQQVSAIRLQIFEKGTRNVKILVGPERTAGELCFSAPLEFAPGQFREIQCKQTLTGMYVTVHVEVSDGSPVTICTFDAMGPPAE